MKISTEEANKKWIESLGKFRTYVSENNEGSRNMLCFYTNLSETWGRFLFEKNVIYGDENGFYRWNDTSTNLPEAGFFAVVIYGNCGNVVAQMATHFTNANTYVRSYNSSWTAWRRII